jgi:hypothetical protein
MAIPKIPSQLPPQFSARNRSSNSSDNAKDLFWLAIILQGLYLFGVYKKIEILCSSPVFYLLILLPAIVFVVAKTWKSAFKFAMLCSLAFPATVSFLLLALGVISLIKNPSGDILSKVKLSLSTGGTVWMVLLVTIAPAVVLGALARVGWNFFRRN